MNSTMFDLNWNDAVKGLVMAMLAGVVSFLYGAIQTGVIDWNQVLQVAIASGLGYILKNYFTDEQGKLLGKI